MTVRVRVVAVLTTLLLNACGSEDPDAGCRGNGNCRRGEFCSSGGECLPLTDNSFAGSFRCMPGTPKDPPVSLESDVVGRLLGEDVSLNLFGVCQFDGNDLLVSAVGANHTELSLYSVAPQPSNAIYGFNLTNAAWGVVGRGNGLGRTTPALLYITDGAYTLDVKPTVGVPLEVHVEVRGVPTAQESVAGTTCPLGNECGPYFLSESGCYYSEFDTFCAAQCAADSDCARYGAQVCDDGLCFRSCAADADCEGKQRCLARPNGNMCR